MSASEVDFELDKILSRGAITKEEVNFVVSNKNACKEVIKNQA